MKVYHLISGLLASSLLAAQANAESADWTGPYVGTYVDVSYDELGVEDFGCWTACTKPTVQGTSLKPGVNLGYDLQVNDTLVVGLAADLGSGSSHRLVQGAAIGIPGNLPFAFESDLKLEATLRARVGLVQGDTLIFVTGGMALAKGSFNASARNSTYYWYWPNHSPNYDAAWKGTAKGMAFGGGIEHRFGPVSARFEVQHRRYQPTSACFANFDGPDPGKCWLDSYPLASQVNYTYSATSLRFGVNYRF